MALTDFITAIDLGTAHMVGIVGHRNPSGTVNVLAHEIIDSGTSIRRGNVFNIDETAAKVKELVRKLESHLMEARIAKIYVGIGGQSLRSMEHTIIKELDEDSIVTEELIDIFYEECLSFKPDRLDVLDIVSPVYYVDGKQEPNPVGVPCEKIEARFQLIVGRPSLRKYVENSISDKGQIKIAGILISPLTLADAVLSDNEKELGCALINFGAGVTSLSVFKGGKLIHFCVIPLGGNLITKDLMRLHLIESEAERVKITYGSAISDKEPETLIRVNSEEGSGIREISSLDVNMVVEARMKEIMENVLNQLEINDLIKLLGSGIVITGGASCLRNLAEVLQKRVKMEVRYASTRKGILEKTDLASFPEYSVAIGLLMNGTENCALGINPVTEPETLFPEDEIKKIEEASAIQQEEKEKEKKKKDKEGASKKRGGFKDFFNKGIDKIGTLFDEDDMK